MPAPNSSFRRLLWDAVTAVTAKFDFELGRAEFFGNAARPDGSDLPGERLAPNVVWREGPVL